MTVANTDEILARLIERVEGRYFGKYRGQVSDNNDPNNLGRVKAKVPRVLADEESGWALPAFCYGGASEQGFFALPDVGAGVWIEFEGGDLSYPIWSGTWYTSGAIPESAKAGQKVLKTSSGHKIVLDDDAGSIAITDSNNNVIQMNANSIQITAGDATQIVIDAPQIQLVNGSSHPLVFGDQLLQYLNTVVQSYQTHMHPGQTAGPFPVTPAPPMPPLQPPTPALLSTVVTTG
jgi:phage baseplate assembly protein gpV